MAKKANTVKTDTVDTTTEDPVEIYENKIYYYADEYINSLLDPEDIYNSNTFNAMINYIYTRVFKPKGAKTNNKYNTHNTILDIDDINTLDNIFNILAELCGKYKKHITLLMFCNLIGIDNNTISSWINGNDRVINDNRASSLHSATAKKWRNYCEQNLLAGAVDSNSVGCIFALKANYGYSDQPQAIKIEIGNKDTPEEIAEDIANRYLENTGEPPAVPADLILSDN